MRVGADCRLARVRWAPFIGVSFWVCSPLTVASHHFKLWTITVLSLAECAGFSLAPGMRMGDGWIRRHRHACSTHPAQDVRALWVRPRPSKPRVQFGPCMTHHSSTSVTTGSSARGAWDFCFLKNQPMKYGTKRYHGVSMAGERRGRQRVPPLLWLSTIPRHCRNPRSAHPAPFRCPCDTSRYSEINSERGFILGLNGE